MLQNMRERWPFLFEQELYGNPLGQWLVAFGAAFIVYFAVILVLAVASGRGFRLIKRLDAYWASVVENVIAGTKRFFVLVLALFVGSGFLSLPDRSSENVQRVFLIVLIWQIMVWGLRFISSAFSRYLDADVVDGSRATSMRAMSLLAKAVFVVILVLWGLDNFGVNIAALVAGLGIGGIAIALALQNILGDLFASLTIVLDKPFVIGDFIVVGEFAGTIENIGLKTTRVRSLSGEQLIFSNADLLQSRIRNYRRMGERRVAFTIGVLYNTPVEKLAKIGSMIGEIISAEKMARFDRAHFLTFADSSLNYEIVYYVLSRDFLDYTILQESINLELCRRFQAEGIGFAYPSRSVYVESLPKNAFAALSEA